MDLAPFRGDPTCLGWNVRDLKALDRALRLVNGRKAVVQAGGNLGVFAAYLAERFEAVYTFEPDPELFKLMTANAPASNIIRFQAALGDLPQLIGTAMVTGKHDAHIGETHVSGPGITPTLRLDALDLPELDLLYLDIEGYELRALAGAEDTIARCRPLVVTEINSCIERYGATKAELVQQMDQWGYDLKDQVFYDHIFIPKERNVLNLVAVRVGDKYGPAYVATLFDMLVRNLSTYAGKIGLWCITDDPDSLPESVNAIPADPNLPGWWQKVRLFSPDMPWNPGERVAYFDLDVAITGSLEELVETKGIIQDWLWPTYNSSVMVWDHGEHREIFEDFRPEDIERPGPLVPRPSLPLGQVNGGDQEWITRVSQWPTFPPEWCVNYREHAFLWPPEGAKVVSFNGYPKPHEVTEGWVCETWKIGGMTSLPAMSGVNTTQERILANIAENVKRDLPWFRPAFPHDKTMVLVCGGPSLKDSIGAIRLHQERGARIVTVNNTLRYLMDRNIKPDAHVMLDARHENAAFLKGAPKGVIYFLASQCDPSLFELLKDHDVTLWHNAIDSNELEAIIRPYEAPERPICAIPGGGTVGLRAIWLAFASGYRKLHIYGMDGSYDGKRHHAYEQSLNDAEALLDVVMNGKHYTCSRWLARQATEYQGTYRDATNAGMSIWTHGTGLIPDMTAILKHQDQAA